MLLKQIALGFMGLCAGGVIAAGVFAFLAMIGIFPRLIGKTKTRNRMMLYETVIMLGGIIGNVVDLYEMPILAGGKLLLGIMGLSIGVFVGCLVMSLAETLKALPVMNRRLHLSVGIQYLILAVGMGKLVGSLLFFSKGIGS